MKKKYEVIVITKPEVGDEPFEKIEERMTAAIAKSGVQIIETTPLTQHSVAYKIGKSETGTFILYIVECETRALERLIQGLRSNRNVLRHMIVHARSKPVQAERREEAREVQEVKAG